MKENQSPMAPLSEYPIRPGENNCYFYLKYARCGFGRSCFYNHPKEIPKKINLPLCKYFLRGYCKFDSTCVYVHSAEMDGAEPMPLGQKRHRTESSPSLSPSPEKSAKTIPEQRREAQYNLQEERLRNLKEQRKRDIERQRREARLRLEQMKPTVHFDEAIRIKESLAELGFILTKDSGF